MPSITVERDPSLEQKTRMEQEAGGKTVYASNAPKVQANTAQSAMLSAENEAHLVGGAHNLHADHNAHKDAASEAAVNRHPDQSSLEAYEDHMISRQGVDGRDRNPLTDGVPSAFDQAPAIEMPGISPEDQNTFNDITKNLGPTPADAIEQGTDGLTLATRDASQNGSLSQFNSHGQSGQSGQGQLGSLPGVGTAIAGLSSCMSGNSLFKGNAKGGDGASVMSPNDPSLRGACDPDHMQRLAAERDQAMMSMDDYRKRNQ